VKTVVAFCVSAALSLAAAGPGFAQDASADPDLAAALPLLLVEEEDDGEGDSIPEEFGQPVPPRLGFSLGPRVGYLRARDADRGTWFAGAQARLKLSIAFEVEASVEFHRDEFGDGDVEVTSYPVQVTAIFIPFPEWPLQPYVLGGAGWYYQRFHFEDNLSSIDDETDSVFGLHVGAGAQLFAWDWASLNADVRYIILDESDDISGFQGTDLDDDEFDYWQLTASLNFFF
jgi:hypothetical protein